MTPLLTCKLCPLGQMMLKDQRGTSQCLPTCNLSCVKALDPIASSRDMNKICQRVWPLGLHMQMQPPLIKTTFRQNCGMLVTVDQDRSSATFLLMSGKFVVVKTWLPDLVTICSRKTFMVHSFNWHQPQEAVFDRSMHGVELPIREAGPRARRQGAGANQL